MHFGWQPEAIKAQVTVCRGSDCRGVYGGNKMYGWNPRTVFVDAAPGDVFEWKVMSEHKMYDGTKFSWSGGECGATPKSKNSGVPGS